MLTACEQMMQELRAEMGADLRESSGEPDHVHRLVRYPPRPPVSTLVNRLKAVPAHYLRKEFTGRVSPHLMHGHLWSPSYLAASCGGAPTEIITQYIDQQKRPGQTDTIPPGPQRTGSFT
jgi:putative transposase